ncbi:MAG TPA: hypothetical protein VHO06_09500 [Polyangia bacterium]|nr:hypothetical protein [Polyangia bacterium]
MSLVVAIVFGAIAYYAYTRAEGGGDSSDSAAFDPTVAAAIAGLKTEHCEPTSCRDFTCETFSEGQTKGLPARILKCQWTDARGSQWKRCGYVHYAVDKESGGITNMYASTVALDGTCEHDKGFADILTTFQGYTGRVP